MIPIKVRIWGPLRDQAFLFLLDTGSAKTVVHPDVVDELGYSPRMGRGFSTLEGLGGVQEGYALDVARLATMGFEIAGHTVLCHEIAPGFGVHGLIGMDLLEGRVVRIDGRDGWLEVE